MLRRNTEDAEQKTMALLQAESVRERQAYKEIAVYVERMQRI